MSDPEEERREAEAAWELLNSGVAAQGAGDLEHAEKLLTAAVAELDRIGRGTWMHGAALANLAAVQRALGRVGAAMENIQKAVFLLHRDERADPQALPSALNTRAVLQRMVGDLDRALADVRAALGLLGERGIRSGLVVSALSNQGVIYAARGEFGRARGAYELALAAAIEISPETLEELSARTNLGGVLRDLGRHKEAVVELEAARGLADRIGGGPERVYLLLSLSESRAAVGAADAARDGVERAERAAAEVGPRSELRARCWNRLGELAGESGDVEAARRWHAAAVELLEEIGSTSWDLLGARRGLAVALAADGDLDAAIEQAERGCDLADELRSLSRSGPTRSGGGPSGRDVYRQLISFLWWRHQDGDSLRALDVAERSRARRLIDLLGERAAAAIEADAERRAKRAAEQQMGRMLGQIHRMIAEAEATGDAAGAERLRTFQRELQDLRDHANQTNRRELDVAPEPATPLTAREFCQRLEPGTAVVQVATAAWGTYRWLCTRESVRAREVPYDGAELDALVSRVVDPVTGEPRHPADHAALDDLSRAFLVGVPDSAGVITVIADGPLHRLPWELLPDLRDPQRPLGVTRIVNYAPSATVLDEVRRTWRPATAYDGDLLAVGDPAFAGNGTAAPAFTRRNGRLAPLPGTRREVLAIAQFYAQPEVHLGEDATLANLVHRAGRFTVVHVATHGLLDDAEPLYGGLALSPPTAAELQSDPTLGDLLQVDELFDLALAAELVVCSACETARGPVRGGEGVIGMVRALLFAGARTVVVSLWKIADDPTATFMIDFHEALHDGAEPGEALRRARERAYARNPDPYLWAPFILHGPADAPRSRSDHPSDS
jgi:tetratricopeptide (TPR) repeat protein